MAMYRAIYRAVYNSLFRGIYGGGSPPAPAGYVFMEDDAGNLLQDDSGNFLVAPE